MIVSFPVFCWTVGRVKVVRRQNRQARHVIVTGYVQVGDGSLYDVCFGGAELLSQPGKAVDGGIVEAVRFRGFHLSPSFLSTV